MSLKTRLANITGTRDSPVQPITVFESLGTALDYDDALATAIAAAPAKILGAFKKTSQVALIDRCKHSIAFEITYLRPGRNVLRINTGVRTKPKKLYNFIAPVGVCGTAGADITSSYPSLKWKPDRQGSAAEYNSGKPVVVEPLDNPREFAFSTSQSFITDDYLDMVEGMVVRGAFNNAIYLGRALATLQIVGFSSAEIDDHEWAPSFAFAHRAFQTTVDIGDGIVIPELRGCDHSWNIEVETYSGDSIQGKVKGVVVGQAWPLEDFSVLNLPAKATLSTRATDASGTVTTLAEGQNILGTDEIVVFWEGGSLIAEVGSAGSTAITFGSGVGDALPEEDFPVLVAKYIT